MVDEKVRREKALDFSGCKSRPGTGSFHPVTIETAAEATKLSKLVISQNIMITHVEAFLRFFTTTSLSQLELFLNF